MSQVEGVLLKQGRSGFRWNQRYFRCDATESKLYYWELDDIGGKPKGVWNLKKVAEVRKVDSKNLYGLPDTRKYPNQFVFEILVKGSTMCVMCADSMKQTQDWMSILTKAINPEMYPPETRKWKIMRDDRKSSNASAAYTGRLSIDSTDEDAVMRTGRKNSSTKTDNSKIPKGPYGLTCYSVLASTGDMPKDVGDTNSNNKNDDNKLTGGVAFSVDFGIERDIIKKIKKLKEKDEKAKAALKSRLVEYEKDQKIVREKEKKKREEERKKREEERKKREEDEEEEEEKTNDPISNVVMDPITAAATAAGKSKKVRQLMSLVGGSEIQCHRLLESNDWNLERAANSFFHSSGSPPQNNRSNGGFSSSVNTRPPPATFVTRTPRPPAITAETVKIPPNVRWQFMDHNGSYVNYLGADARHLEVAYQLKKDTCELRNKFGHYRVTFLSTGMTQMNVSTRKIRNVRRLLINNGPRLTPQQQQKVNQLMSFVGGGEAQCRDLLIKSNWDLQSAINGFFDSSSSRGGGGVSGAMFM